MKCLYCNKNFEHGQSYIRINRKEVYCDDACFIDKQKLEYLAFFGDDNDEEEEDAEILEDENFEAIEFAINNVGDFLKVKHNFISSKGFLIEKHDIIKVGHVIINQDYVGIIAECKYDDYPEEEIKLTAMQLYLFFEEIKGNSEEQ